MKLIPTCVLFLVMINQGFSQCKDSLAVDTYYQCNEPQYDPVCGCDQVTYRNSCAAEHWGGLINNGFSLGWTPETICGNFDFDFLPTAITSYNLVVFSLYMKAPGSATLYIYNRYGGLMFADFFSAYSTGQIIRREINLNILDIGIYFAVVIVNGEKQFKKIAKVSPK